MVSARSLALDMQYANSHAAQETMIVDSEEGKESTNDDKRSEKKT